MDRQNNRVYGVGFGKLYLSGEYAILEDNAKALIMSVDKKIIAKISPAETTKIRDNYYNEEIILPTKNKNFLLIQNFIKYMYEFLGEEKNFFLEIENSLQTNSTKYGFGSSAALLVAILRSMLNFYKVALSDIEIFKLIASFNIKNNIKSSMGDVAASVFGGIILYKKFLKEEEKLVKTLCVKEIIKKEWQGLDIKKINPKLNLEIIAKWTGEVIDTKEHIVKWERDLKDKNYLAFVNKSNYLTERLAKCLEGNSLSETFSVIREIRENLLFLEKISSIKMETPLMKEWISNFNAGKQSGSGSGDMVLGFKKSNSFKITLDLEKLSKENLLRSRV